MTNLQIFWRFKNPEKTWFEYRRGKSGNDALALVLEHKFALILLDVQMPDMDGFETAEIIRRNEETKNIPIIFVTAISKERKYVFKGYDKGAVDYLFKPLDPGYFAVQSKCVSGIVRTKGKIRGSEC